MGKPEQNQRNYYRILFVQPDAPPEIIQSSYRTLMQKLKQHPDLGGEHWNATVINEAFEVLMDPVRRKDYDAALFKDSDLSQLGRQHAGQRAASEGHEEYWQPFRAKVL